MNMRQQIRKEREAFFATATTKEKIAYIWEYYGLFISLGLILCSVIIFFIVQAITAPDSILYGIFANSYNRENSYAISDFQESYLKDREIDTSEYTVTFGGGLTLETSGIYTSYESSATVITQISGEKLDFIVGPEKGLYGFAYNELFVDLSEVLTPEQYEYYEPYFLYVDKVLMEEIQANDDMDDTTDIDIPDTTKPEEMQEPIPVFIDLSSSNKLDGIYGNKSDSMVYAITCNAVNMEQTLDLLDYLMR